MVSGSRFMNMAVGSGGIGRPPCTNSCLLVGEKPLTEVDTRGCVSGEQVVHVREKIGKNSKGEYNWDAIDGWEELEYVHSHLHVVGCARC